MEIVWQLSPSNLLLDGRVDIWRINLQPSGQVVSAVRPWLAADEVERSSRFRFERDRLRYIIGRGAMRHILGRYLATSPQEIPITYTEHRKPILANSNPLHFNLSNSHELALLAVGQHGPVGVDLEYRHRRIPDVLDLAETVFSDTEQQVLKQTPEENQHDTFLRGWTRKEAYLKGIGKGLMVPLQNFTVSLEDVTRPSSSLSDWHLFDFRPSADYLAALATPYRATAVNFYRWLT
ncbi:MAG: 4'-phosphopantetheinyl transferase superfamily protein [Ardenticatenaceae bacterium]|nr:4'-phosphopantetheinyl transferase superfamily protein [Ardenticatenaceae bacterium]